MRIAVYHNLPSGGAKRTLQETIKRLSKRHIIDVFTLATAEHDFCDIRPFAWNHHVFDFSPLRLFSSPFGRLNQFQRWRDLLRLDSLCRSIALVINEGQYDVVFVEPCMFTQAPVVLKYLEVPSVYYCQEPPRQIYEHDYTERNSGWRRFLDRIDPLIFLYYSTFKREDLHATRTANRVLVNSKFIQSIFQRLYGFKSEVSYHGIDTNVFRPSNTARKGYILSVGAIQPHKGYDFLIKCVSKILRKTRPPLRLIGNQSNSSERDNLENLAVRLGVELYIEENVSDTELIQSYKEAILFVYSPHNEPFGLAPLEAMACGTPVIGVDEGGVKETVVNGKTGYLSPRDTDKFSQKVIKLLKNKELREQMGKAGRQYVLGEWSWESSTRRIEAILFELAHNSNERTS